MRRMLSPAATEAMLERLRAQAREAAEIIRPHVARMDLEDYCCFLNTMYHYTRHTGAKARTASSNSPPGALREFFEHMQREEQGHYRLAEADLNALGYAVHPDKPAAVEAFDRYWASIPATQPEAYLGALVVFENIARHLGPDIAQLLARLALPSTQTRWLRVHAQADELHGTQALELAQRYVRQAAQPLLEGAERARQLWTDIFRSALTDRIALQPLQN